MTKFGMHFGKATKLILALALLGQGFLSAPVMAEKILVKSRPKKNAPAHKNPTKSCLLIQKEFSSKSGKPSAFKEYYLRCSVDDYFIKFCESQVTPADLAPYLDQGIKVEMELKEGLWDQCPGDESEVQSRSGTYAAVHKIRQ